MMWMIIPKIFTLSFIFLNLGTVQSEDSGLSKLFKKNHIKGTMIISSLDGKTEYVYNKTRATKRFLPASTFKIPNTLIALDEGAIADEKEIIKWDGQDKGYRKWNRDQSLETAFPTSCVWFYQELARRIGRTKYLSHLEKLKYGNRKTGPDITTFWLEGQIRISAIEQIAFLKKLYRNELPYKRHHIEVLKKIMIVMQTPTCTMRAKTGWAIRINHQYGWYVGYIETEDQVWFFATNIDIEKKSDAAYRKELTIEALELKGIL